MHKALLKASASVQKVLTSCGIITEKVPYQSALEKEEIQSMQSAIIGHFSSFPTSGCDLLNDVVSTFFILSTGCDHWDELLDGGLYSGEVTEIAGSAGSGKTQVCMSIATSVAMNIEKNVVYIDTQAAFSSDRIKEMLYSRDSSLTGQDTTNILSRIKCIQAFDIFDVINCLNDIKDSLNMEDQGFYSNLRLVIVDSVAFVIAPILGGQQTQGHSFMVHLSRDLKSLALEHGLSVMVTNNVVTDALTTRKVKPALGQTWSHIPNTRIFLQKSACKTNERIATVVKSSRQPTDISTTFFIQTGGLQDYT
ncbi:DNA repair protein RAD51 homolog 4-like isoform X2 [Actinia tenebrosa]|uniref:DNA repair protein RAD51 homolog 4-like isoform X2 n=1 Tax=Actinia tenebrosa TaxID=6105 RepID=A0A6P8HLV8_ACTTE|nr:DNA repair protein RAD51 homolog 4-like isoform X2 [Actinia tenebrosa]